MQSHSGQTYMTTMQPAVPGIPWNMRQKSKVACTIRRRTSPIFFRTVMIDTAALEIVAQAARCASSPSRQAL